MKVLFQAATVAASISLWGGQAPVRIEARVGDDAGFVKRIRVVSDAAVDVLPEATPLTGPQGREVGLHQITITPNPLALVPGVPKDLDFKLTGVRKAGVYKGAITFVSTRDGKEAGRLDVEVKANDVVTLTPRKDTFQFQRTNCIAFGCTVAAWLDPSAAVRPVTLQFDNATSEAFTFTGSVSLTGDATRAAAGVALPADGSGAPIAVAAAPHADVLLPMSPEAWNPDKYIGDARLLLPGHDTATKVPVEIDVRSGPLGPLVALLVGILLGRGAKYMKDHGAAQSDLLLTVYRLEDRLALAPDRAILMPMIEDAKHKIYDLKLEAAQADLLAIEKRFVLLNTLRQLEMTLSGYAGPAVTGIVANIAAARVSISNRNDAEAETKVKAIETAIAGLSTAPAPPPAQTLAMASAQATTASVAAARASRAGAPARALSPLVRALSWLTGVTTEARAELALWVLRPMLYCVLLMGLLILGLQQLYLKNPAFGANAVGDYFGLFVWAMSADVASRTVSTLKTGA